MPQTALEPYMNIFEAGVVRANECYHGAMSGGIIGISF